MILPQGHYNCHAEGLHSIVVSRYATGRPRLRMFLATAEHTLWRNNIPACDEPMSIALHAHRARLTLIRVFGPVHQVRAIHDDVGAVALRTFRHTSHLLTGHGGFEEVGSARFSVSTPFVFDVEPMSADALHTVYIPEGERAAWYVHEHETDPAFNDLLWSNDDLTTFDFTDMYEPMSQVDAAMLLDVVNREAMLEVPE